MKIAVVGSGVSGLAATWLLNAYSDHEVHLYEADSRPGGHANTVSFIRPGQKPADVDTGFVRIHMIHINLGYGDILQIVFNPSTYPNFLRFLKMYPVLCKRVLPTAMTFSVSRDGGAFEWAGNTLGSVFCEPSRLLDTDIWCMLYDILRFNACARRLLREKGRDEISIGEYLKREKYSSSFRNNYLIPMTAAIWSTPPDKCALDFPARTLIQFMHNHHLLQITGKPPWLTLEGGSRVYVEQILSELPPMQLHLSTAVQSLVSVSPETESNGIELCTAAGECVRYDHVILACHSDTALAILRAGGGVSADEEHILGSFAWSKNVAVLHSDVRLMPRRRVAWSCWNYLTKSEVDERGAKKANVNEVSLTYYMNDLQHIPESVYGPVLVTLNPPFDPDPETVVGRYEYDHPVLGTQAIRAQHELHLIQRMRCISFAGAWTKYGFHEDGFTSGLRAAAAIMNESDAPERGGKRMPFEVLDADRAPKTGSGLPGLLFDVLEGTGLRMIVGACMSLWLMILKRLLGAFGVDMRHLDNAV